MAKSEVRRLEIRRNLAEQQIGWWRRLRQAGAIPSLLVAIAFTLLAIATCIFGKDPLPLQIGQRAPFAILSRVNFSVQDNMATLEAREDAKAKTPCYFRFKDEWSNEFDTQFNRLIALFDKEDYPLIQREDLERIKTEWILEANTLEQAVESLHTLLGEEEQVVRTREQIVEKVRVISAHTRFISQEDYVAYREFVRPLGNPGNIVFVIGEIQSDERKLGELIVLGERGDDQWHALQSAIQNSGLMNLLVELELGPLQNLITEWLHKNASQTYWFDKKTTTEEQNTRGKLTLEKMQEFKKDYPLVSLAELVNDETYKLLAAEQQEFLAQQNPVERWGARAGLTVIVMLVCGGLVLYVAKFEHRIVRNWSCSCGLALLLLLLLGSARLAYLSGGISPFISVGFAILCGMLLTIAYSQRFAMGASLALVLLIAVGLRVDLGLFLTLVGAVGVSIFSFKDLRSRMQIIQIGFYVMATTFLLVWAVGLWQHENPPFILKNSLWAGVIAMVVSFLVLGFLPLIERLFNISTSMTMLEWCDANKPLLKRFPLEAPGTFAHSILIAQMAEAAADAIGANGLLCRVGAYYHDIGKLNKPEYFVENQQGRENPHDHLAPAMSQLIIIGHVKDGLAMAKEYGLPPALQQFITEHHGTTLVEYFYHAAKQRAAEGKGESAPSESDFRYPGPRPRSKETAICLLCDSVEAAVRAIAEPTPSRIEATVSRIARKRLMDGQFDESDLTLKELDIIEKSLVKTLGAFYHGRIAYPAQAADWSAANGGTKQTKNTPAKANVPVELQTTTTPGD